PYAGGELAPDERGVFRQRLIVSAQLCVERIGRDNSLTHRLENSASRERVEGGSAVTHGHPVRAEDLSAAGRRNANDLALRDASMFEAATGQRSIGKLF